MKGAPGGLLDSFDQRPFHRFLGLTLAEWRQDFARLRLRRTASTPTGIGDGVNGGVIATMVDMAAVAAVFTDLREGATPAGTADLQVTYLRPADGEYIDALAQVVRRGRQLVVVEVSVQNMRGLLYARGRVLYALRPGAASS